MTAVKISINSKLRDDVYHKIIWDCTPKNVHAFRNGSKVN